MASPIDLGESRLSFLLDTPLIKLSATMKIPFLLLLTTLIPELVLTQSPTGWEVDLERIGAPYQDGLDHLHDPVLNSGHLWRRVNTRNIQVQLGVNDAYAALPHVDYGAQPIICLT
jgi:hypothetical protein